VAAKLLIAQRKWIVLRRFVKLYQTTRRADGWVGFPFQFTDCDLGHDGGLRGSVGKRSPEYNIRSPFFLAAMGSTCIKGKPNGNQKREGTTLTLGKRRSKKRRLNLLKVSIPHCRTPSAGWAFAFWIVFCLMSMSYPPVFGSHWVYLVYSLTPWQQEKKAILCYTPVISFLPSHANPHLVLGHIP